MTELMSRPLKFWDQEQRLICKRLDEDYKIYSKIKYLEKMCTKQEEKELLSQYRELQQEKSTVIKRW